MPYVQEPYLAFLALAAVNALHNIDLTDVDGFHSLNRCCKASARGLRPQGFSDGEGRVK